MAIVVDANYLRKVADGLDQSDPRTFKLAASLIGLDAEFKAYEAANAGADVATWLGSLAGTGGSTDTSRIEAVETAIAELQAEDPYDPAPLVARLDGLDTSVADEIAAREAVQAEVDAITLLLAADDPDLDTAQERIDRIKSLVADVESLQISDIAGLQAALDAAGGTSTLRALTLTPGAAESPTLAEVAAALPAGTKPGDIVRYTTPRGVTHGYDVVAGPNVVRRPGNWVYDDTLPPDSHFRPGDSFRFLNPQGLMEWVRVNAAGSPVTVNSYPTAQGSETDLADLAWAKWTPERAAAGHWSATRRGAATDDGTRYILNATVRGVDVGPFPTSTERLAHSAAFADDAARQAAHGDFGTQLSNNTLWYYDATADDWVRTPVPVPDPAHTPSPTSRSWSRAPYAHAPTRVNAVQADFANHLTPTPAEINALASPGDTVELPWLRTTWRVRANLAPEVVKASTLHAYDFSWKASAVWNRSTLTWSGNSNTAVMATMIDEAQPGDTIVLPAGNSILGNTVCRKGIHIRGAGRFATKLICHPAATVGEDMFQVASPAQTPLPEDDIHVRANHLQGFKLSDLTLDGHGRSVDCHGLGLWNTQHCNVENVDIVSFARSAWRFPSSCRENLFTGVHCRYSGSPLYPQIDVFVLDGNPRDGHNNLWFMACESVYGFGPLVRVGSDEEDATVRNNFFVAGLYHSGPSNGILSPESSWYGYDASAIDVPLVVIQNAHDTCFSASRLHSPGVSKSYFVFDESPNVAVSRNSLKVVGSSLGGMLSADNTQPIARDVATGSHSASLLMKDNTISGRPSVVFEGPATSGTISVDEEFDHIPDGSLPVVRPERRSVIARSPVFHTLTELRDDTTLGYSDTASITLVYDDQVRVVEGGFVYRVVGSGASSYDYLTAGGIKLKLVDTGPVAQREAFRVSSDPDDTASMNRMFAFAIANDVPAAAGGQVLVSSSIAPGGRFVLHANNLKIRAAQSGTYNEVIEHDGVGGTRGAGAFAVFDTSGCDSAVIEGYISIESDVFLPDCSLASRALITKRLVAITACTASSSGMVYGSMRIANIWHGLFHGSQNSTGVARIHPYAHAFFGKLFIYQTRDPITAGKQGSTFDDTYFGAISIRRCWGRLHLLRTALNVGSFFWHGLIHDKDNETQTLSLTAGSATAEMSADNASIGVGSRLAVRDSILGPDGVQVITDVYDVTGRSGTTLTLSKPVGVTEAAATFVADPPSAYIQTGSLNATHAFIEAVFDRPFDLGLQAKLVIGNFKVSPSVGARSGAAILARPTASAEVHVEDRTEDTRQLRTLVEVLSAKEGGGYQYGRVEVKTKLSLAEIRAHVEPIRVAESSADLLEAGASDCSLEDNSSLNLRVATGSGDHYWSTQRGGEPGLSRTHRGNQSMSANLRGALDMSTATATGSFSIASGVATKTSGSGGSVYEPVTTSAGDRLRVEVNVDAVSTRLDLISQNGGSSIRTEAHIARAGRHVFFIMSPAGMNRIALVGYSSGTATVRSMNVQKVLP